MPSPTGRGDFEVRGCGWWGFCAWRLVGWGGWVCCGRRRFGRAALASLIWLLTWACLNILRSLLGLGRVRVCLLCRTLSVVRGLGVRSSSRLSGRGRWGRSRRCSLSALMSMRRYFASARRAARSSPLSMASLNSLMMALPCSLTVAALFGSGLCAGLFTPILAFPRRGGRDSEAGAGSSP